MNSTSTSSAPSILSNNEEWSNKKLSLKDMDETQLKDKIFELNENWDSESQKEVNLILEELRQRKSDSKTASWSFKKFEEVKKELQNEIDKEDHNDEKIMKLLQEKKDLETKIKGNKSNVKADQKKQVADQNTKDLQNQTNHKEVKNTRIEDLMKQLDETKDENKKLQELVNNPEILYLPLSRRRERKRLLNRQKMIESLQGDPEKAVVYITTMTRKLYGGKVAQSIKKLEVYSESLIFGGLNKRVAKDTITDILKKLEPTQDEKTKPELKLIEHHKRQLSELIKKTWNNYIDQETNKYKIA